MSFTVTEEPMDHLRLHAGVPSAFLVERVLEVSLVDGGLGGITLREEVVEHPWWKDYDAIKGEGPTRWQKRFDLTNWGLVAAHEGDKRLGGAVIAFMSPGVEMLEDRDDLAVLWDIRVRPECRSRGVGSALFRAAESWARQRGCRMLKIETQSVNVPACHFYARMGCSLGAINLGAYRELPEEVQLLWHRRL